MKEGEKTLYIFLHKLIPLGMVPPTEECGVQIFTGWHIILINTRSLFEAL
jgi:hypothetical protein